MSATGLDFYSEDMSKKLMYLAAALLVAACGPKVGKTTRVTGQFGDEVPETVRILVGESLDTTVTVTDGRFTVEIPTNLQELAYLQTDFAPVNFIADGSTITVDPMEGTAVSSNKKGPQSRFAAYDAWMRTFMTEYRSKMAGIGDDEDAVAEYYEQILPEYNEYQKATVRANGDNILGVMALMQLMDDDPEELKSLLTCFSGEMRANPMVAQMISALASMGATAAGSPFVDFAVIQDPDNPETSTVRLSDYVGNGKYVLVDFWASWCDPCREEMPTLRKVYETYAGDRFDMLSVAVSDDPEDSLVAAEAFGITWNQIVNAQRIPLDLYGIDAIPHVILFGPDGTILKRGLRGKAIGEAVKEALGL